MPNLKFAAAVTTFCSAIALAATIHAAQAQSPSATPAPITIIRAGTLIDGTSDKPTKNQVIFVQGDRIIKV